MRNIPTLFIILLAIALVLFTISYIIDSDEIRVNAGELTVVTGEMQSFEAFHESSNNFNPTKKTTERYDEKLLEYLDHIQESKDNTFQKGKVFLRE